MMNNLKVNDLKEIAKNLGVKNWWLLKKSELIEDINEKNGELKKIADKLQEKEMITKFYENCTSEQLKNEIVEEGITELETQVIEEIMDPTTQEEDTQESVVEDLVTLKEIISELGIKGTKARRILRSCDIPRPYKRWEWSKEEHRDIIKLVKDLLSKTP